MKIYLPEIIKSGLGADIQLQDLDKKMENVTMKRVIDLCLINYNVGQITIKDAVLGAEIYDILKSDAESADISEELYNWLFNVIDIPLVSIFGMNAIFVKEQLFQDEDKIREKLKEKFEGKQ